jgi:hypothetical protein
MMHIVSPCVCLQQKNTLTEIHPKIEVPATIGEIRDKTRRMKYKRGRVRAIGCRTL